MVKTACPRLGLGLGPGLGLKPGLGWRRERHLRLGRHARERLQLVLELSDRGRARDRDLVPPRTVSHPDLHGVRRPQGSSLDSTRRGSYAVMFDPRARGKLGKTRLGDSRHTSKEVWHLFAQVLLLE
jgi:hypothetical protein